MHVCSEGDVRIQRRIEVGASAEIPGSDEWRDHLGTPPFFWLLTSKA